MSEEAKYEHYLQSLRDDWKADSDERQAFIDKLEAKIRELEKKVERYEKALKQLADDTHMINDCGDLEHSTHCVKCFAKQALTGEETK